MIYQEIIMDHYRNPRNRRKIASATFNSGSLNPSCGDEISIQGIVDQGIITDLAFQGKGCVISQATASLLTDYAKNKSIHDALTYNQTTIQQLLNIALGPTRLRCALLSLEALQKGLNSYLSHHEPCLTK